MVIFLLTAFLFVNLQGAPAPYYVPEEDPKLTVAKEAAMAIYHRATKNSNDQLKKLYGYKKGIDEQRKNLRERKGEIERRRKAIKTDQDILKTRSFGPGVFPADVRKRIAENKRFLGIEMRTLRNMERRLYDFRRERQEFVRGQLAAFRYHLLSRFFKDLAAFGDDKDVRLDQAILGANVQPVTREIDTLDDFKEALCYTYKMANEYRERQKREESWAARSGRWLRNRLLLFRRWLRGR